MLLTLAVSSLRSLCKANGDGSMSLLDVPQFAINQLQLRGLNLPASMLRGWGLNEMDRLRDEADKAGCPCLVLVEDTPLKFAATDPSIRAAAVERVQRLAVAANRLGCNAIAIPCDGKDTDESFERTATELKNAMSLLDRFELNVLLTPAAGLTEDPARLTDLIKRIGGFRIGSLPRFGHAASSGDCEAALRKLAPYAGAIHATVVDAKAKPPVDLSLCVSAIRSVGYVNTLAIEYTGKGKPVEEIDRAREVLQAAIDYKPDA